jgi:hypothetical protein
MIREMPIVIVKTAFTFQFISQSLPFRFFRRFSDEVLGDHSCGEWVGN